MNTNKELKEESTKQLLYLLLVVFLIWVMFDVILYYSIKDWNILSLFGDMFGAINSLFTGLAFAGLIYTIILQKKELRLQRLELIETRKELARSALAQEKSEIALSKQVLLQNMTAQLTSLNILINYNTEKAERIRHSEAFHYFEIMKLIDKYANEIELLFDKINKINTVNEDFI